MISIRNTRLLGGAAALLIGSALATVLPAGAAHAAVPGLVTVTAASPSNSVGKAVTVSCPVGKQVVGAGAFISGAPAGQVALDDVTPNAGLLSVTASAYETDGSASNWQVIAVAKCANPLPGLVRVFTASPNNSVDKNVTANCPTGTDVIAAGSQTNGGLGDVIIDRIAPNAGLTSVTVSGKEDAALARNWSIDAYAICANPLPGLVGVAASPPSNSVATRFQAAACPIGTVALGGGAEVVGGTGEVLLSQLQPAANSTLGFAAEEDPFALNWTVVTTTICALP